MKFKANPYGTNEVLKGEGFFVSYNPNPGGDFLPFQSDGGSSETALVKPDDSDNKFRILNGDYRKKYEELAPQGFEACLNFYNGESVKNDSSWSTHHVS